LPQSPEKQKEAAQSAALLAFQQLRRRAAIKKTEGQTGGQLTPPKIRKQKIEDTKETNTRGAHKLAQDENVDTERPSETRVEQGKVGSKATQPSPVAARAITSRIAGSDRLAVWHPEPSAEKGVGETGKKGAHMKAIVPHQRPGVSSGRGLPTPGRPSRSIGQVVIGMAQSGWLVVEPVFDPESGIRRRFERRRLTWQDVGLFVAAAMFMTGTFLATIIFARVVGLGLQAMNALGPVFWLFTVF
jgi:hypothetical protein